MFYVNNGFLVGIVVGFGEIIFILSFIYIRIFIYICYEIMFVIIRFIIIMYFYVNIIIGGGY